MSVLPPPQELDVRDDVDSEIAIELKQYPPVIGATLETRFARSFSMLGSTAATPTVRTARSEMGKNGKNDLSTVVPPPAHPICLEWQKLRYGVKERTGGCCGRGESRQRELLRGVSGVVRPGELLAVLGPSGAGKTTLLNLLAGKISDEKLTSGQILINGTKRNKLLKRNAAFVMQEDLFFSSLTVRDTLTLTGNLLLPSTMSVEDKRQRVEDIIALLNLEKASNTKVGDALQRGLSGGEKKRLNIANELITDPSLLILDEPTSGLDSYLADEVVSILKMLASTGRTVITTLHQPSSQMFSMFDKLCLLAEGGTVCYFGPAKDAVKFFSRLERYVPPLYNPADYYLEQVQRHCDWDFDFDTGEVRWPRVEQLEHEAGNSDDSEKSCTALIQFNIHSLSNKDGAAIAASSSSSSSSDDDSETTAVHSEAPFVMPPPLPKAQEKWPISWGEQFKLLYVRAFKHYLPAGAFNVVIFLFIALFGAIIWWDRGYSEEEIADRMGLMFFILLQWFMFPLFGTVQALLPEIAIVRKERGEGQYRISAYALAKTVAEFSVDLFGPISFSCVLYFSASLNSDPARFFVFLLVILLSHLLAQSLGFFIGAATGSLQIATPINLVLAFAFMLVGGFYAAVENIPVWFRWLTCLSPLRYAYDALLINEFDDGSVSFSSSDGSTISGREIVDDYDPILWGESWGGVWYNILVLVLFYITLRILGYFSIRKQTSSVLH